MHNRDVVTMRLSGATLDRLLNMLRTTLLLSYIVHTTFFSFITTATIWVWLADWLAKWRQRRRWWGLREKIEEMKRWHVSVYMELLLLLLLEITENLWKVHSYVKSLGCAVSPSHAPNEYVAQVAKREKKGKIKFKLIERFFLFFCVCYAPVRLALGTRGWRGLAQHHQISK